MPSFFHRTLRPLAGLAVVLALFVALAPATLAQGPTPTPTTWKPPTIYKAVDNDEVPIGTQVTFTITVANPGGPSDATWYNLKVTDVLDPAFQIDSVTTTRGTVTITGNTVVVNGTIILAPGEYFVITVVCTLVGPVEPGATLVNEATLEYTDPDNNPLPPVPAPPVKVRVLPPPWYIPEPVTLVLLGGGLAGLAGYVGWRRRKS